jgi:hypothetical protein
MPLVLKVALADAFALQGLKLVPLQRGPMLVMGPAEVGTIMPVTPSPPSLAWMLTDANALSTQGDSDQPGVPVGVSGIPLRFTDVSVGASRSESETAASPR